MAKAASVVTIATVAEIAMDERSFFNGSHKEICVKLVDS
jgi:hypothetical protein